MTIAQRVAAALVLIVAFFAFAVAYAVTEAPQFLITSLSAGVGAYCLIEPLKARRAVSS